MLVDLASAKTVWQHQLNRPSSLTGQPPHLACSEEALLLLVPRNHATELVRLDLGTGASQWTRPILHGQQPLDLKQSAIDGTRCFLVVDGVLQAVSLQTGKPLWSAALPEGERSWQVSAGRNLVLACPERARTQMDSIRLYRRLAAVDLTMLAPTAGPHGIGPALAGLIMHAFEQQTPSRFVVLAFDPVTGRAIRKLEFDGRGPQAQLAVFDAFAVVTMSEKVWVIR